ncbi:hypothetical protein [Dactylosporangium sp. NPDC005555]|uniref:hypothetical protein n=1 Tax=Dactylosporangium sp. NPDC005555 TaxID=3154889 RepID=UPI0033B5EE9D
MPTEPGRVGQQRGEEAFVIGAGGWVFWYDGPLGVPLAWLSFLGGRGIDALIRYSSRPPRAGQLAMR